jgi:hypothetical protein
MATTADVQRLPSMLKALGLSPAPLKKNNQKTEHLLSSRELGESAY